MCGVVKVFCACGMFKVNFCHSVPLNGALQLSHLRPVFVDATNARRAQIPRNHKCAMTLWVYEKEWLTRLSHYSVNPEISTLTSHRICTISWQARFVQFLPIWLDRFTYYNFKMYKYEMRIPCKPKMQHITEQPLAAFPSLFTSFLKVNDTHWRYVLKSVCMLCAAEPSSRQALSTSGVCHFTFIKLPVTVSHLGPPHAFVSLLISIFTYQRIAFLALGAFVGRRVWMCMCTYL